MRTLLVRDTLLLECEAEGSPPPQLTWRQNDVDVSFKHYVVYRENVQGPDTIYSLNFTRTPSPTEPPIITTSVHCMYSPLTCDNYW